MLNIPEYDSAKKVFHFFEEISKIPHTSEHTEKIADYLVDFAKAHVGAELYLVPCTDEYALALAEASELLRKYYFSILV